MRSPHKLDQGAKVCFVGGREARPKLDNHFKTILSGAKSSAKTVPHSAI